MTASSLLLIGAAVFLGLGLSVLLNLIPRPIWVKRGHLAALVIVALVAGCAAVVLNGAAEKTPAVPPPPTGTGTGTGTAVELAPELRDRIVLSTDDSAGSYLLFASRLDGTNRRRVADWGGPVTAIPRTTDVLTARHDELSGHSRIEVRTMTGELVRALTRPPVGYGDDSVSYAATAGYVNFVRTRWNAVDARTSTAESSVVMRVRIDGAEEAEEVRVGTELRTVAVDDSGRIIAGACDDPSNVGQACLTSNGGDVMFIPGSEGTTMSDIRVSPDGRYVAYSSFAVNPFGESQVFLYDLRSKKTVAASRLSGLNRQPAWVRGSTRPCLLFTHDLTGNDPSVYLTCLRDEWQTAEVLPIGQYPELAEP